MSALAEFVSGRANDQTSTSCKGTQVRESKRREVRVGIRNHPVDERLKRDDERTHRLADGLMEATANDASAGTQAQATGPVLECEEGGHSAIERPVLALGSPDLRTRFPCVPCVAGRSVLFRLIV